MTSLGQPKIGCGCLRPQQRPLATTTSSNTCHRPSNLQRRNANAGTSRGVGGGGGGKPMASSSSAEAAASTSEAASAAQGGTPISSIPSHVYHQRVGTGPVIGPYGLRRVDYSSPPPKWPLPPKPPQHSNPVRRYFPLFLIATAATLLAYIYVNREDEELVQEYWKAVEQGDAPISMTRDDNDDDEDADGEDGDYDLDRDEWEDDNDKAVASKGE
jgi:hypothetical protein